MVMTRIASGIRAGVYVTDRWVAVVVVVATTTIAMAATEIMETA